MSRTTFRRPASMLAVALGMALAGIADAGKAALKTLTGVPDLANVVPGHSRPPYYGYRSNAARMKREARTRRNIAARSNKQRPAKLARKIAAAAARRK